MTLLSGRRRLLRIVTVAPWIVLVVGLSAVAVLRTSNRPEAQNALTVALGVFFLSVVIQLTVAVATQRARRRSLTVLLVAVLLWALGSAVLNGTAQPDLTRFPSPGEGFFLLSYVGFAAYLVFDAGERARTSVTTWLETAVISGGAACLAGGILLSPVASDFGATGLPLFLSLLYPLLDVLLLLVVVAQVVLRRRELTRSCVMLCAAFGLWALADTQLIRNLSRGTYDFSVFNDLCWGAGFAFLALAACCRRTRGVSVLHRRMGSSVMGVAGLVAMTVLVLRPDGGVGAYLMWPAVVTMLAAGGRLAVALREANRANEAFALSRSDDLTLLPNRRAILARLDEELPTQTPLALMILDLDGFKDINDTLGHIAGDTVLQVIGDRMRATLSSGAMVARLGGDEFAVIVTDDAALTLMETGRSILDAVREPIMVDGVEVVTDASLGITIRTGTETRSGELLRRADVAMYQAKRSRAGALLYDAEADDFSRQKLQLSEELRRGIGAGQIELWYQPQVDTETRDICGLEALVRWRHPEHGIISPAAFLPAARRAGLMQRLSEEIGRLVVADMHRWQRRGRLVHVAMNCAPPELMSGAFLPRLYDLLRVSGVDASCLTIEVTEDSFLAEPERARTVLLDIREHALQISIDDYGTGFSSLSYLRDLPVNELKIDRSFISAMTGDLRSHMIVASTIQMAHALGLRTVAEGIEDQDTADVLYELGVDVLQGYHIGKPMPGHLLDAWMEEWNDRRRIHPREPHPVHRGTVRRLNVGLHNEMLHARDNVQARETPA